jgi:hypothetical protein
MFVQGAKQEWKQGNTEYTIIMIISMPEKTLEK